MHTNNSRASTSLNAGFTVGLRKIGYHATVDGDVKFTDWSHAIHETITALGVESRPLDPADDAVAPNGPIIVKSSKAATQLDNRLSEFTVNVKADAETTAAVVKLLALLDAGFALNREAIEATHREVDSRMLAIFWRDVNSLLPTPVEG